MQYRIITGTMPTEFQNNVNRLLDVGWRVSKGSLQISCGQGSDKAFGIVLYKKDKDERGEE